MEDNTRHDIGCQLAKEFAKELTKTCARFQYLANAPFRPSLTFSTSAAGARTVEDGPEGPK